jgi:hypothetical protein
MDEVSPNQKPTWRIRPVHIVGLLLVVTIVVMWPLFHHWLTRPSRDVVQRQFDHAAILRSARSMLDAVPNTHFGWSSNPEAPIDDPRIPKLIRNLGPRHVYVYIDHVKIEFAGGFEHYGLFAYREGTPDRFGGRKLI